MSSTKLPCPACGYDVRPELERSKRVCFRAPKPNRLTVAGVECPSCRTLHRYDSGITANHVGPERLVWAGATA